MKSCKDRQFGPNAPAKTFKNSHVNKHEYSLCVFHTLTAMQTHKPNPIKDQA